MYFRARYYDPLLGEFISRDPFEYVDGMSLYRAYFVPGRVDPSGQHVLFTATVKPAGISVVRGRLSRKKTWQEKSLIEIRPDVYQRFG